jgi:hypothetical protein
MAANTYTLISSNVLASSAASVTFSSIPATYTDLVVRASIRSDRAAVNDGLFLTFNSDTASVYSATSLYVNNSTTVLSGRANGTPSDTFYYYTDGANATSNTFSNTELYIPSYTASQNKPLSLTSMAEGNTTNFSMGANAGLWRNTAAMTSINIVSFVGANFVTGSSFYLYGIKKN